MKFKPILYLISGIMIIALVYASSVITTTLTASTVNATIVFGGNTRLDNNVLYIEPLARNENENAVIMLKPGGPTRDGSIRFFNSSDIELWDMYVDSSGNDNFMIKDKVNNSILVNINRITHDSWFKGDVSALSFTDRTERSDLTVTELKSYISQMDFSRDVCNEEGSCEIDKTQYPDEWVSEYNHCLEYNNESECINSEVRLGRDLTKMVSDLLRVMQSYQQDIEVNKADVDNLKLAEAMK